MPTDQGTVAAPGRRLRSAFLAAVVAAGLVLPPAAQAQLRSVVVPADSGVAVAARGQPQPKLVAPPAALAMDTAEPPAPVQLAPGGQGLMAPLGIVLPLAAGALLGGGLARGSGGGDAAGAAPTRTR
ncbi:hypothetical protein ACFOD4_03405 [Pseudoroseomonas globiformis]|uniref:Uncharacterized protein n=1 Tax=Teichococcus globiformis TaxID=2307229 RepID=A0ABV7FV92_9PROT